MIMVNNKNKTFGTRSYPMNKMSMIISRKDSFANLIINFMTPIARINCFAERLHMQRFHVDKI